MIDRKPYLIRAIYEWIVDNDWTPHIVVDTNINDLAVPEGYAKDGFIVLNIAPKAVQGLNIDNDNVTFSAMFAGQACSIWFPIASVAGIYARENNEGLQLAVTPVVEPEPVGDDESPGLLVETDVSPRPKGRPKLTVVKKPKS